MADTLVIRRRIKSISSTRQITKAMQLVAASKLRAAATAAATTERYRRQLDSVLSQVALNPDWVLHPLVQPSAATTTHVVLIGSDHTLAGAYHSRLETMLSRGIDKQTAAGHAVELTTIGRIPAGIAARTPGISVYERLDGLNVLPTIWEVQAAAHKLVERYQAGEIGCVLVIATRFESALRQVVETRQLLPLTAPVVSSGPAAVDTPSVLADAAVRPGSPSQASPAAHTVTAVPPTLEPDSTTAITAAIQNWLRAALLDSATNAVASEHAMRMLAMQNATTNAGDLIDDLTLEYNTARQAAITQELAEISGGVAALS